MFSDCEIVALVIQHVKRMRRIMVPYVACLEIACFFTLFHEGQNFRKCVIENKICLLVFSTILSEIFLILRRSWRDIFINVYSGSCNITCYYCQILMTIEFHGEFRKILYYQISLKKTVQWQTSYSTRTDGQTYRHEETNSGFSQFC